MHLLDLALEPWQAVGDLEPLLKNDEMHAVHVGTGGLQARGHRFLVAVLGGRNHDVDRLALDIPEQLAS